ncbi:energy transducer TonB [Akkermansiaceae bacterium]|nr:energy transducer TonB [Akkermansiaceae bacterium]
MNSRSSQPLIWIFVAVLTAALFAGALKWGKITIELPDTPLEQTALIDLSFVEFQEPAPEPAPEPLVTPDQPAPKPEPEPMHEPEPVAQAEPEPTPPEVEPTLPPEPVPPKIDPGILKKEREAQEARKRELARQRELARKRIEEKRLQKLAARKADAARAAARKQVVSKPSGINQPKPKYPSAARRAGQQGTVTLSFTVGTSGTVTSVRVAKSSGHSLLDNAALAAIRRWRFKPARNALGEAISYSYTLPVPFRLR